MSTADFHIYSHGSVWSIIAQTENAKTFARKNFVVEDWQGISEHFTTDWRPARDICERLVNDGFNVRIG